MQATASKLFILGLVIISCGVVLAATNTSMNPSEPSNDRTTRSTVALWNHFFQQRFRPGDDVSVVKDVMSEKALDWGRLNWGGTGHYSLRYKLDDFLQAEFQFDRSGTLISSRVFARRELWLKDPEANILHVQDNAQ